MLKGGNAVEAMKLQQEATGMAMQLLEGLGTKVRNANIKGGAQMQLAVVTLANRVGHNENPSDGTCLLLHKVFKVPPENDSVELTIIVILYNLAYMFHIRGLDKMKGGKVDLKDYKADLQKANDLYGLVKTLVIDGRLLTMDNPVLELSLLNNLGQLNHCLGEKAAMKEMFILVSGIMKEKLSEVSDDDQTIVQFNLMIREKIEVPAIKKQRLL